MYGEVIMNKKVIVMFLILFSLSYCLDHAEDKSHYVYLQDPNDLINPHDFYEYMIIKNDHLSHLAYKFYYDGIKWTKIYEANPYIIDPNWIYPDNWLVIPGIYSDEKGNLITTERAFIYKSIDEIIAHSDSDQILDNDKVKDSSNYKYAGIDLNGDDSIDGVDIESNRVTDTFGIDTDNNGQIDRYDIDGDGMIDAKSNLAVTTVTASQIDIDGDGIVDGVDLDGDGFIDAEAGIDLDGDGIVDGYDLNGDGYIDIIAGAAIAAFKIDREDESIVEVGKLKENDNVDSKPEYSLKTSDISDKTVENTNQNLTRDLINNGKIDSKEETFAKSSYLDESKSGVTSSTDKNRKSGKYEKTSTYKNPNWVIGLHGGYPFGDVPDEEDNLAFGLLIGTPLRITLGPISARLGAGFLGYDFTDKLYPGAGVLFNLAISELLKWTTPVQLQVHGTGFYVPGGGIGTGVIASTSVPLGKSPFNIGLYIGFGEYNNSDSVKSNWKNTGLLLQLQL